MPAVPEPSRVRSTHEVLESHLDAFALGIDALVADGGFLKQPAGADYEFSGGLYHGRDADEKGVIGEGVGIAIRKQDAELKQKLDKALAAIRANGKYDELRKKYFDYDIYGE